MTTLNEFTAALPTSGSGAILDGAAATYHKSHPSREWRVTPPSPSVSDRNVNPVVLFLVSLDNESASPPTRAHTQARTHSHTHARTHTQINK